MTYRFLASLRHIAPGFLWGSLRWSFRNNLLAPPLQGSTCMLLFSVSSGECYSPSLIQSTYFLQGRKGLAPNLIGSGRNLGEGSCLLTLNWLWNFFLKTSTFFLTLGFLFIQDIHCVCTKSACWEYKRNMVKPLVLDVVLRYTVSLPLGSYYPSLLYNGMLFYFLRIT